MLQLLVLAAPEPHGVDDDPLIAAKVSSIRRVDDVLKRVEPFALAPEQQLAVNSTSTARPIASTTPSTNVRTSACSASLMIVSLISPLRLQRAARQFSWVGDPQKDVSRQPAVRPATGS